MAPPPAIELASPAHAALTEALAEAQRRGLLGPGAIEPHVEHALGFARALGGRAPTGPALDLGSGAGLPGLVLAVVWPTSTWVLLDASARRIDFLAEAIGRLGLEGRVAAEHARAEDAGREAHQRGRFAVVTSRSFGPPTAVAEAAAPLLVVGGTLVVSEPPPTGASRWPPDALAQLGLAPGGSEAAGYVVLRQRRPCPERFPRRAAAQRRHPLF